MRFWRVKINTYMIWIRKSFKSQLVENFLKVVKQKQKKYYFLFCVNVNQPLWCAKSNLVPFTHHQTLFGGSSLTTQSRLKSRPFGFFPVFFSTLQPMTIQHKLSRVDFWQVSSYLTAVPPMPHYIPHYL